ncbi:MAG: MBL fold metallo-hydrolase [bacterium]
MEIIIIGSGTAIPTLKRASPAIFLKIENQNILIDSGSGTLRKLLEAQLDYLEIDYLLYTHLHPDHTIDFVSFLFACKNPVRLRENDLKVIGPVGFKDFYDRLLKVYGDWIIPQSYNLFLTEVRDNEIEFDNWRLKTMPIIHSENSVGYRFQTKNGKSVTISGDTDYCPQIVKLAQNTDLLILECAFPDEIKVEGHLTPYFAAKIARESNCKKLVLTHFYPLCDDYDLAEQCKKHYSGEFLLSEDLMRLNL